MKRNILSIFAAFTLLGCTPPPTNAPDDGDTEGSSGIDGLQMSQYNPGAIIFSTSQGVFVAELYKNRAPITTDNFMRYVLDGFYDGKDGEGATIFHRTINDFMIQGGGYTVDGTEKSTYAPIENEAIESGLSNVTGTLAMARTNDPDSATAQFFINTLDNVYLDAGETNEYGYAVFGYIVDGMNIVEKISESEVDGNDRPIENVVIQDVWIVE